jgi:hypothetical protein
VAGALIVLFIFIFEIENYKSTKDQEKKTSNE